MRLTTVSISLVASLSLILAGAAVASLEPIKPKRAISQKGRRFGPSDVSVKTNEDIYIQNDDGDLIHDAYVDSPDFSFESGDINPGASIIIAFPKEGDYTVLCGIHPTMKLIVHVQANTERPSR